MATVRDHISLHPSPGSMALPTTSQDQPALRSNRHVQSLGAPSAADHQQATNVRKFQYQDAAFSSLASLILAPAHLHDRSLFCKHGRANLSYAAHRSHACPLRTAQRRSDGQSPRRVCGHGQQAASCQHPRSDHACQQTAPRPSTAGLEAPSAVPTAGSCTSSKPSSSGDSQLGVLGQQWQQSRSGRSQKEPRIHGRQLRIRRGASKSAHIDSMQTDVDAEQQQAVLDACIARTLQEEADAALAQQQNTLHRYVSGA